MFMLTRCDHFIRIAGLECLLGRLCLHGMDSGFLHFEESVVSCMFVTYSSEQCDDV